VLSINEIIHAGFYCEHKNPQYAYIAPTFSQAKRIAWDYVKEYTKMLPGFVANEQGLYVSFSRPGGDRVKIFLLGGENPDSIRGMYLDGCVLDEYGDMPPIAWKEVVRPALSDRTGWAIFIGTPKGMNHFYEAYRFAQSNGDRDWYAAVFKASETGLIPQAELEAAKAEMGDSQYAQEYECSFNAALTGSYYGTVLEALEGKKQITSVPYEPSVPVVTAWDLGMDDTTAIWFVQYVGKELHVIDFMEMSGVGLDWYARELSKKPYVYDEHFLPHDSMARELGTGVSRMETLQKLGLRNIRVVKRQNVADGINAVRLLLPKCYFDAKTCGAGLDALKNYQRKFDERRRIFQDTPLHDWSSHAADAFRYLALGTKSPEKKKESMGLSRRAKVEYNIFG
jgi:hypothetical protein